MAIDGMMAFDGVMVMGGFDGGVMGGLDGVMSGLDGVMCVFG